MNERERIELIMKSCELTPSQFADKTGIQRASVSHILSGRNKPSLEVMLKIYDTFPWLDMKWLMTGEGELPVALKASAVKEEQPQQYVAPQPELFSAFERPRASESRDFVPAMPSENTFVQAKPKNVAPRQQQAERAPRRSSATRAQQIAEQQPVRKIKEIRVFYTDGTYETMYPEK